MYKKAGIVIAIILVAAGILALSISSCNKDGGIQVKNNNEQTSEVVQGSNKENEQQESLNIRNSDENTEESKDITDEVSELELISENESDENSNNSADKNNDNSVDNSIESKVNEVSTESKNESSLSKEEQSALEELKKYKDEQTSKENSDTSKEESSKQESKIDTEDGTEGLRYKEIKSEDLPSDKKEKNVIGIITGKEILVEGNNIFTTIIILDENSDSYRYFVPKSAYDSLEKGTKLDVSIIVYFDGEKSIKQVTGVSVAE